LLCRFVKNGKPILVFNKHFHDLSEIEKIYTAANPNVENVECLGRRSEAGRAELGLLPPPDA
jgi:hypothetical protein